MKTAPLRDGEAAIETISISVAVGATLRYGTSYPNLTAMLWDYAEAVA